jgi:2-octaprenyl-6-methoxyphenol hydroxylase
MKSINSPLPLAGEGARRAGEGGYDVLIVGAGLVGASLALSFANTSLRVAVTEANPILTNKKIDADGRSIALTYSSIQLLENLNIWPAIKSHATAINTVHVSHKGHFGMTRFQAHEENVPMLGCVVPAQILGECLQGYLLEKNINKNIKLFNPAKVELIKRENEKWTIQLNEQGEIKPISSRLIIAADGTHSTLRSLLNIKTDTRDYQQSAIATTVTLNRPHQNIAYERFLKDGAIALLPRAENTCALIWTASNQQIEKLMQLDDDAFLQQAQQQFGYRLGKLEKVTKRFVYPLTMTHAEEQVREGFVLLGNAAHTMHPIAAQGFNLGLGDVAVLNQVLVGAVNNNKNFTDIAVLQEYAQQRQAAQQKIMTFTDSLTKLFARDLLPFNMLRSCSLLALDFVPALKHRLAGRLMGINNV